MAQQLPPPPPGYGADDIVPAQQGSTAVAAPPPPPGYSAEDIVGNGEPDNPGSLSHFLSTSGIKGIGEQISKFAQHPIDTAIGIADQGGPEQAAQIKAQFDRTKSQLKEAYKSVRQGNYGDAVTHAGYSIPMAGNLIEELDTAHKQDQALGPGHGENESGAVAGLVGALMLPDVFHDATGYAKSSISKLKDNLESARIGKPSVAAESAQRQGVAITSGRARTGVAPAAEKFLRDAGGEDAEPFLSADKAARIAIEERGADIANQIFKTDLSPAEQGEKIQNSLRQTRDVAGANVGDVHRNIANLAPDATLNTTGYLQRVAQEQINKLQIDPESAYAGEETPQRTRVINELQKYANPTETVTTPASTILDGTGAPLRPEITQEVPKVLPFGDANKLLQTINDLIPDATSAEGGALKQVAKALREEMYNSLDGYGGLKEQLKASHQRYATVVNGLENGIGKRVLGTRNNPTSPELVANYLANPRIASQLGVTSLRTLLGPERMAPVARLIVQHLIESSEDGAALTRNFDKLPDPVKNSLLTPDQLDNLQGYVRDVRNINIKADPTRLPDAFGGPTQNVGIATKAGFVVNVAKNVAMKLGAKTLARMLLDPHTPKILRQAILTPQGSRGAAQLTQRLMFAAQQSGLRDEQEDNARK